jgi:hypothetical protein
VSAQSDGNRQFSSGHGTVAKGAKTSRFGTGLARLPVPAATFCFGFPQTLGTEFFILDGIKNTFQKNKKIPRIRET